MPVNFTKLYKGVLRAVPQGIRPPGAFPGTSGPGSIIRFLYLLQNAGYHQKGNPHLQEWPLLANGQREACGPGQIFCIENLSRQAYNRAQMRQERR